MTTIEFSLPDDLARQAESAGLLNSSKLERWLREQLQQKCIEESLAVTKNRNAADQVSSQARRLEAMERLGRLSIDFSGKPMDDRESANARY